MKMLVGRVGKREFWFRQLRQWHWVSSAACLLLMLMFAISGITLNHAGFFEAKGESVFREYPLAEDLSSQLSALKNGHAVPDALAAQIRQKTGVELSARIVDNQYGELDFDLARPGKDANLTIDLNERKIYYEEIDRGVVAMLNDLHKGRNAGLAWTLLIDVGAAFFIVFTLTGLGLLFLHGRMRPSTWPLVSLGFVVPVIVYVLLVH